MQPGDLCVMGGASTTARAATACCTPYVCRNRMVPGVATMTAVCSKPWGGSRTIILENNDEEAIGGAAHRNPGRDGNLRGREV